MGYQFHKQDIRETPADVFFLFSKNDVHFPIKP